jgi:hypothetical protein
MKQAFGLGWCETPLLAGWTMGAAEKRFPIQKSINV